MTSTDWILAAVVVSALSGAPALLLPPRSELGHRLSVLLNSAGCALGFWAVYSFYRHGPIAPSHFRTPIHGFNFAVGLDGLSAFFLMPVLLICALASVYSLHYWPQREAAVNARRVSFFLGLMTAAMIMLVAARDLLLFLTGWEIMAVAAYFLVAAEDHLPATRKAAWVYIAASHVATLCVVGAFALIYSQTGTYEYTTLPDSKSTAAICLASLALVGFGTKAGLMPMHVWLPGAHASAPSHVSAVMSGVMIKMGVYGLFRVGSFFSEMPLSWALTVLAVGTVSAILGVAFAIGQHDIKRLLAYHSIENVGIIVMGLGLALVGRAAGRPEWVLLGICGALLHVWNHAIFKSLLFFGAGSIMHATGTRELDVMGGLGRRMPATAIYFLIGAVAICGLPPLNGFVSELLIYLGLFRTILPVPGAESASFASAAAFAAPGLALVGALAVACFVKVYGIVFLGVARSERASEAHESGLFMTTPMFVLAACCVLIGFAPVLFAPLLDHAASTWAAVESGRPADVAGLQIETLAPLRAISMVAGILLVLVLVGSAAFMRRVRTSPTFVTWDCGYAAPTARMQYSSSSFAQWLVDLFAWALQPRIHAPKIDTPFQKEAQFESHVNDTVLEKIVDPTTKFLTWLFGLSRYMQQGSLQVYLLYIFVILVGLLAWIPSA